MMSTKQNFSRGRIAKVAALLALVAAWVAVPYFSNRTKAAGIPILVRSAVLAAPSGSINPHGAATWQLYSDNNKELEVEIEDVSLPAGTVVAAIVDGNQVGTFAIQTDARGRLKLRTENGQPVPTVNNGSTVQVVQGSTVLVAGVFGGGGPTPSPTVTPTGTPTGTPTATPTPTGTPTGTPTPTPTGSPSPSPNPSPGGTPNAGDLFAGLTGPTLNGVLPTGFAQYELHSSRTELEIRVRQVFLPAGTSLAVAINNTAVGNLILESGGEGRLRLRSDNGQNVPVVTAGQSITLKNGATTVLSGTFSGFAGPSPTPTGTPGPTPSPSPSPAFGRSFEAHLNGAGMTPPVTTNATGEVKVALNAAETQATVFGEFHGLSSNQTAARIETLVGTTSTVFNLGVIGGQNGNFPSATFAVTPVQVQQLRAGLWSAVIASTNNPGGEIRGTLIARSNDGDFDGDGRHDFAVFRPSTATWYSQNSTGFNALTFGSANDKIVSGDYDGDGKTDAAVYQNVNGQGVWNIRRSSDSGATVVGFGLSTDVPVRGDFDGDGRLDVAVYRPSNGVWYIQNSNGTGISYVPFGIAEDRPMPADMDGDGKDDIVVYRPSQGDWFWMRSSDNQFRAVHFGQAGDQPVRGDFDGDGKSDVAVFRPSNGVWYILKSSDGSFYGVGFGLSEDVPVTGNFDGDTRSDISVFRPSNGMWYTLRSSDGGFQGVQFGTSGDVPVNQR